MFYTQAESEILESYARRCAVLKKQIENTEKHIERLNEKLSRYRPGLVRALIAVELASCQETLLILKAIRDGKEIPLG